MHRNRGTRIQPGVIVALKSQFKDGSNDEGEVLRADSYGGWLIKWNGTTTPTVHYGNTLKVVSEGSSRTLTLESSRLTLPVLPSATAPPNSQELEPQNLEVEEENQMEISQSAILDISGISNISMDDNEDGRKSSGGNNDIVEIDEGNVAPLDPEAYDAAVEEEDDQTGVQVVLVKNMRGNGKKQFEWGAIGTVFDKKEFRDATSSERQALAKSLIKKLEGKKIMIKSASRKKEETLWLVVKGTEGVSKPQVRVIIYHY